MPEYKTIIFDLDGLIVDTEPLHMRAINAFMKIARVEHQFDTAEYGEIFTGRPVIQNAEYMRERFGLPQTAEVISEAHRALFNVLIADPENLDPMPGVQQLIEWLLANEFRIGIASSSRPEQVNLIMQNINLHHHFSTIMGNDGTLKPKPSPDVYLLALQELGVRAEETLALEDSNPGVRAARNAGITVIAVPNEFTKQQDFSMANFVMKDLNEVREYLAGKH